MALSQLTAERRLPSELRPTAAMMSLDDCPSLLLSLLLLLLLSLSSAVKLFRRDHWWLFLW
jgi:hypothetical protein